MAKKSSSHKQRQGQNARPAANKAQASAATLVRSTRLDASDVDTATQANTAAPAPKPSAASVVRDTPAAPAKPAPKPAVAAPPTKPAAPAAKAPAATQAAASAKRQDTRIARARATQRARQAGMITAENYSYVLEDLKLVAILAACAVVILIALTFTLPH